MIKYIVFFLLFAVSVQAETVYYTADMLADAIYWAEGGHNTNYPYGIKSVRCKNGENGGCREVCKRTIRNNRKRYKKSNIKKDKDISYLDWFANIYCPTTGDITALEKKLNKNWLKNVKYYLRNPKPVK